MSENKKNNNQTPANESTVTIPNKETFEINSNRRTNHDSAPVISVRKPKEDDDKPKR